MSLLLLAHDVHPRYRLVVAANRDEFHRRETEPAGWWEEAPDVLAGRDWEGDGAWLGITRDGRFAAITAYRDPKARRAGLRSRGWIVRDFLEGDDDAMSSLRALSDRPRDYNPFTVVLYDGRRLGWCSNRIRGARELGSGIHGLANHLLDTPWPKVVGGKHALEALLASDPIRARDLLALLDDRTPADDAALPNTGVGVDCERWLSPRFVVGPTFGTRTSTAILLARDGGIELVERSFDAAGVEVATARFAFPIGARGMHGSASDVPVPAMLQRGAGD